MSRAVLLLCQTITSVEAARKSGPPCTLQVCRCGASLWFFVNKMQEVAKWAGGGQAVEVITPNVGSHHLRTDEVTRCLTDETDRRSRDGA